MLTPKGLSVLRCVSRMASRNASGLGWVSAVRIPAQACGDHDRVYRAGVAHIYRDLRHWKLLRREGEVQPCGNAVTRRNLISFPSDYLPLHTTLDNRSMFVGQCE